MALLPVHNRSREPQAARDLIRRGYPRLGFALAALWVIAQGLVAVSIVLASFWMIREVRSSSGRPSVHVIRTR